MGHNHKYKNIALIVAAGLSLRAKVNNAVAKQYFLFKGKTLLQHSIDALLANSLVDGVCLVVNEHDSAFYEPILSSGNILKCVSGGQRRQDSVYKGLLVLEELKPMNVLVHDAVRPFVTQGIIDDVINALNNDVGVVPTIEVNDSIGYVNQDDYIDGMLNRAKLRLMQTPQGFKYELLFGLYKKELNSTELFTDEVSLLAKYGYKVRTVKGSVKNRKITYPQDLQMLSGFSLDLLCE